MTNKINLPIDPNTTRKDYPLYSGLLTYFPNALAYVSYVSKKSNVQHNPGEPLHWARDKSTDHLDCLLRHLARAGERDSDGLLESGKVAWRALAQLEEELEELRTPPLVTAEVNGLDEPCTVTSIKWRRDVPFTVPTTVRVEPVKEKPKTLYDWSRAPGWAMWAATGEAEYGLSCWFSEKPSPDSGAFGFWNAQGCKWENMQKNEVPNVPWRDSLEARPTP